MMICVDTVCASIVFMVIISHFQTYIVEHEKVLEAEGLIAMWLDEEARNKLLSGEGAVSREITRALTQGHDLLLSSEFLAAISDSQILELKAMLAGFDEIVVVWSLREPLSHMISAYNEHCHKFFVPPFAEFALHNLDRRPSLDRYVKFFGAENIHALDYYGYLAAGDDEVNVILCTIAGYHCAETSTLRLSDESHTTATEVGHENVSRDFRLLPLFHHVFATHECSTDLKRISRSWDVFNDRIRAMNVSLPMHATDLTILSDKAEVLYQEFLEIYKSLHWHYVNPEANAAARLSAQYSEVALWELLSDASWRPWLNELIEWHKKVKVSEGLC